MVLKYLHKNPVPDETCMAYAAQNKVCNKEQVCQNTAAPWMVAVNWAPATLWGVPGYYKYTVGDHGEVKGEDAMKKEIYARGPISCGIACDAEILLNYSDVAAKHEGVFVTDAKFYSTDHIIEVAGWGETESGLKYWVIRNSWGTYWGDRGWFKVRRGVNQNLIESGCTWAVPEFEDMDRAMRGQVLGDYARGIRDMSAEEKEAARLAQRPLRIEVQGALLGKLSLASSGQGASAGVLSAVSGVAGAVAVLAVQAGVARFRRRAPRVQQTALLG